MFLLKGRLLTNNGSISKPLSETRFELFDTGSTHGWLGGGKSDPNGFFELQFSDEMGALIGVGTITVQIKVYRGSVVAYEGTISTIASGVLEEVIIPISEYDPAVADETYPEVERSNYSIIYGTVSTATGLPLELAIRVSEAGFRETTELITSSTNKQGYYEIKLANRQVANTEVGGQRMLLVEVLDETEVVGKSELFAAFLPRIEKNIVIEHEEVAPVSEFSGALAAIEAITGSEDLATVTINSSDSEVHYLANATGLAYGTTAGIVSAHIYAEDTTVAPKFFYALIRMKKGDDLASLVQFNKQELTDSINTAIDQFIIDSSTEMEIEAAVDEMLTLNAEAVKALRIETEDLDYGTAFTTVFADATLVNNYLAHAADFGGTDRLEFWDQFQTAHGETATKTLKKGFQLLAITGFQPEMAAHLLSVYGIEDNIHELATLSGSDWEDMIEDVGTAASTTAVPKAIVSEAGTIQDVPTYAAKLKEITQRLYPFSTINAKLGDTGGDEIIPDDVTTDPVSFHRDQVISFLGNNPKFDLRFVSIHDINGEDYDLTDISDVDDLKETLAPFQRVSRIAGGKPDAMAALLADGLSSALDISSISEETFVEQYSEVMGGEEAAKRSYSAAADIVGGATNALLAIRDVASGNPLTDSPIWPNWDPPAETPDLATLFGSQDKCSCEYCMSIYSPAAYYVDIMRFLTKLPVNPITGGSFAYAELTRRRPDLAYIDLTCKNSNTPLPYVDLVNELLEMIILEQLVNASISTATVPLSFQTSGKAAELAARPEHMIRVNPTPPSPSYYEEFPDFTDVYDLGLKDAVYPDNLPFRLGLEEARVYLKHLGLSRYELLNLYKPFDDSGTAATGITPYNRYNEFLCISKEAADIIVDTSGTDTWIYFGFERYATSGGFVSNYPSPSDSSIPPLSGDWDDLLKGAIAGGGIDILLHQLKLSFIELSQLLCTRFLNPKDAITGERPIKIVAKAPPVPEETCVLKDLEFSITLSDAEFRTVLGKLHRYVRLWRVSGLSIYAVDKLLMSIGASDITATTYGHFVQSLVLAERLHVSPDYISVWMSDIDTEQYIDFNNERQDLLPSFYDQLFRSKSVLNPPDPAFSNFSGGVPTFSVTYEDHTAAIAAALRITEVEVIALLNARGTALSTTIDLSELSLLVGLASMAKGLHWSIQEFLLFSTVADRPITSAGLSASSGPSILNTIQTDFIDRTDGIQASKFSLKELSYLLLDRDEDKAFQPKAQDIQTFFEEVRRNLKKIDSTVNTLTVGEVLQSSIIQQFAAEFSIKADMAKYLLEELIEIENAAPTPTLLPLLTALLDNGFIRGDYDLAIDTITGGGLDPEPYWDMAQLYDKYYLFTKLGFIINRLKIKKEELEVLHTYHSSDLGITDVRALPVSGGPELSSPQFIRYANWFTVRDKLRMDKSEFVQVAGGLFGGSPLGLGDWHTLMISITGWDLSTLEELTGDNVPSPNAPIGALSVLFPEDFAYPEVLARISSIMDASKRIGLIPTQLLPALQSNVVVDDAHKIMKAARARHSDEAWLKIAKPIHDVLREKQRQALVSYVIANPVSGERWKNENELFAYLLIDVEMKPCMMTSRIKQAISSVQLYVDRLIMNLEAFMSGGSPASPINKDQIKQWKTWRKWYRIWEANRKIFIYPENWIEPELRDRKTPFFKELETQLLQDEVTTSKVEDAYLEYLEKTDEVARMEPVTSYRETDPELGIDIVHVVARTYAQPQHYYYRKLEHEQWTPWERMNLEIKSDHLTLVVWNRRLHVYWLTFVEKTLSEKEIESEKSYFDINGLRNITGASGPAYFTKYANWWVNLAKISVETDNAINDRYKYWMIHLNWSELKDGKWLAPKVARDPMELKPFKVLANLRNLYSFQAYGAWNPLLSDNGKFFQLLSKNYELEVHEIFKNRLYLLPRFENEALFLSICFAGGSCEEYHVSMHAFICDDSSVDPRVYREGDRQYQFLAPNNTVNNKMKFEQWESIFPYPTQDRNSGTLDTIGYRWTFDKAGYFIYNKGTLRSPSIFRFMPLHYGDTPILESTPYPPFRITARADMNMRGGEINPMESDFFYEDKYNNYFVRKVNAQIELLIFGGDEVISNMTLGDATATYAADYNTSASAGDIGSVPWTFGTVPRYYFQTFFHPHIHQFIKSLKNNGIDALMSLETQDINDTLQFDTKYDPTWLVANTRQYPYPKNIVDFKFDAAYSQYNWELFFHIPMLVAGSLSTNLQFEEAQKWYHYIFDPTSNADDTGFTAHKKRFWKFRPFHEEAVGSGSMLAGAFLTTYSQQIQAWEANPFQPHVIARMRILAYMKNVVMKYIDNLIAWGDQLFRRNTIESINEAIQLYILAANILGPKPQQIPARATHAYQNFDELLDSGTLDDFSNAMVAIESFFEPNAFRGGSASRPTGSSAPQMQYFCIASNEKLLAYWDTVADRLFKIRNCMNIDGRVQQLPLFEPPIDPALLVRATAAGIDINTVLDQTLGIGRSLYRFNYTLQKVNELVSDLKSLGNSILSALEKKDAEQLALLRSKQEIELLDKVTYVKENQVNEAKTALEALQKTRENTNQRYNYYSSRVFMNANELKHLQSVQEGMRLQVQQSNMETTASYLALLPQFHGQFPGAVGISFGGQHLSTMLHAVASSIGTRVVINNAKGSMAATTGGYERRRDDWNFQAGTAKKELEQLDKQIIGAEIRIDIAERELANHLKQADNSRAVDEYMREKFTNKELYNWMVTQLSACYFQTYQLAYDLAVKAEQCYDYELPHALSRKPKDSFVKFGYWDSLRKGLLSGERLQFDLRKMEHSYMEENRRYLELTKHVSLASLDTAALADLITGGSCTMIIPEWLYDMDYPGNYLRRIKSVSISIPCVAGPYTTISCKLTLVKHKYRETDAFGSGYAEDPGTPPIEDFPMETDGRFSYGLGMSAGIATSHAQNDSGMFELSFRDERYLHFEGAGAVSKWEIELSSVYPQFDYNTISDVILHINYTALDAGELKNPASEHVKAVLEGEAGDLDNGFLRGFSLRREFSSEWYAYNSAFASSGKPLEIRLTERSFPAYCKGKFVDIDSLSVVLVPKVPLGDDITYSMDLVYLASGTVTVLPLDMDGPTTVDLRVAGNTRILKLVMRQEDTGVISLVNMDELLEDVYLIAHCTCTELEESDSYPLADDVWTVQPRQTDLNAWWRAGDGITISSGKISEWQDQENTNHLTPTAPATAPTLDASAPVNGYVPVKFDGDIHQALYTGVFGDTDNFTAFILVNAATTDTTGLFGRSSGNSYTSGWALWIYMNKYYGFSTRDGLGVSDEVNSSISTEKWQIVVLRRKASDNTLKLWVEGALVDTETTTAPYEESSPGAAISIGSLATGSGDWGSFKMLEGLIYDSALADADVTAVYNYLRDRYSLWTA